MTGTDLVPKEALHHLLVARAVENEEHQQVNGPVVSR